MTRCFVALELDATSRAYLASAVVPMHAALKGRGRWPMRMVRAENWHLTLLFFPDLSESERAQAWEPFERGAAAGAWRDCAFAWSGLAPWPNAARPSLIALEAEPYADAALWPIAPLLGHEPFSKGETQYFSPFRPHITVMRFDPRWRRTLGAVWEEVVREAPPLDPARIRFDRVSFLLSTVTREQPVYPRERMVGV